jgi:uncharacterized protein (TIGR01777 family)
MSKKIVIAGGSGFIGTALANHYTSNGFDVIILTRGVTKSQDGTSFVHWNGNTLSTWVSALEGAEILINLTGKSVDCRYTDKNKQLILSSRINATQILGEAINILKSPPKLWINSSTATIYKHSLTTANTETNGTIGNDFSMTVAQKWEDSFYSSNTPRTRKVALRISLVLGDTDGVLPVLKKLTQIGLGGHHGSGNQKFAWIHIHDLIRIFDFVSGNDTITGSLNCTSPSTITNYDFMKSLRKTLNVKFGIPTPKLLLEIGSFFLRTEPELILKSRFVQSERLLNYGFIFRFTKITKALKNLIRS